MPRTRLAQRLALTGVVVLLATVAASPAAAEERTCRGTLGAVTVDNLRVPDNATCRLNGTKVKGTIKVETDATLVARGVRVIGNVQAEDALRVIVKKRSRIGGSVQVKQGGSAAVLSSRVNGDIQYDANAGRLRANDNVVGGSIQVVGNFGGAAIFRNVVDGNLQCKENDPPPTGAGNKVGGTRRISAKASSPRLLAG
jgi:cytoskeletal protein CcmA (bactofilin family)